MKYILHYNFSTMDNDTKYTHKEEFISMTTLKAFLDAGEAPYKIYNYEIKEVNEIEIAINNIFKESGYEVLEIAENTIVASKFDERKYTYTVDRDIILIKNRMGLKVFEKSISSYQDLNITVTID